MYCGQKDYILSNLPFFYAQLLLRFNIRTKKHLGFLVACEAAHQLTAGKDFSWIQHSGLQRCYFYFCRQMTALRKASPLTTGSKGHGELHCAQPFFPIWGIEHADAYCSPHLRSAVPQFPAMQVYSAVSPYDPGNVRTIIRYDGLCCFLLGQSHGPGSLKGIQAALFQLHWATSFRSSFCPNL